MLPCGFVIVVDAAEQLVRQSDGVGMLVSGHSLNGHCHFSSTFSQSDTAWIAHLWQLRDQFHQVPMNIVAVSTGASKFQVWPKARGQISFFPWHHAMLARKLPALAAALVGPTHTFPGARLSKWSLAVHCWLLRCQHLKLSSFSQAVRNRPWHKR